MVVTPGETIPYGEPLTIRATVTVTSGDAPVNGGTVNFTENGGAVYPEGSATAACQDVVVTAGIATCTLTALAPSMTPYTFGALYSPGAGTQLLGSVATTHDVQFMVSRASSFVTLSTRPDPLLANNQLLTATVIDTSRGSRLPPTGTVDFELGGVALACAQGTSTLVEASAQSSSATCEVPAPTSTTTYSASYVPANGAFTAPVPAQLTVATPTQPPTSPTATGPARKPMTSSCSSTFTTLWGDSGTLTFSPLTSIGGNLASLSIVTTAPTTSCSSTTPIDFTSGSLSLFGTNVTGSGLSGYIQDSSSEPQLCFTSGTLGLYSSSTSLSGAADLCFSISSATSSGGTVDQISSATFTVSATVAIGSDVSLSLSSIQFGTGGTPPAACSLGGTSDVWLYVDGSMGLAISGFAGSVSVSGCYDFTAKSLNLSASFPGLSYSNSTIGLTIGAPTVTVTASESGGTWSYTAQATATLTAKMPSGSSLSVTATLAGVSGGFVIGVGTDLSPWLGSDGSTAWIGYASVAVGSFDTGMAGVGTIAIDQGLNFAFVLTLSSGMQSALSDINLGSISTVVASGSISASSFTVNITIGTTGVQLFSSGGTSLDLDSLTLGLTLSATSDTVAFTLNATLTTPANSQNGYTQGSVALSGTLSAGVTGGVPSAMLSISVNPSCTQGAGWDNAFGINGLDVLCATLSGGVSATGLNVAFSGTITSLPTTVANVIGLQSGAVISFAFELDPFVLSFSITGSCPTCVALEPLTIAGAGPLVQVDSASIYIAPSGGTIGTTSYPAGYSVAFRVVLGSPLNVTVDVAASISFSPLSFSFTGQITEINLGGVLAVGPVTINLSASSSGFSFAFTASLSLSGTLSDNLTSVSGSLNASITANVSLSASGAFEVGFSYSGTASGTLQEWVGSTCPWYELYVPACSPWYWDTLASGSVSVGGGFSLNNNGITVTINLNGSNYSVTLPFSSAPTPPGAPTPPTPAVALTTSSSTPTWAQQVTFTATVSATNFDGGGTIDFTDNGADIVGCASQSLVSSSGNYSATCTVAQLGATAPLPVGSDSVQAVYSGDSNFGSANSSAVAETVSAATPNVTLNLSSSSVTYGKSVTFTATVNPTDGGGTVAFSDNGSKISGCGAVSLALPAGFGFSTYSADATCTVSTFPASSYLIQADYSGDSSQSGGSVNASNSANEDLTVNPAPLTVTSNNASMTYGGAYPTLSASYVGLVNGDTSTTEGPFTTCTSVAATSNAGTYQISCSDTDPNYSATYVQTGILTINPAPLTVTSNNASMTYGGAYPTLSASYVGLVNGDTSNKESTFTTCTSVAATSNAGTYQISCSDTDPNYSATYVQTGILTIKPAPTHTALASSLDPASLGQSVTYTATLTSVYPGGGTPIGSVEFFDYATPIGACGGSSGQILNALSLDVATCTITYSSVGNHSISVRYLGSHNFIASGAGPLGETVDRCKGSTEYCNLKQADLQNADLTGMDLQGSNLLNAYLVGANLTGANLSGANLRGANLTDANLTDANLTDANLNRANLTGANLTGATMTGANVNDVTWSNTSCPDGSKSDADGGTCVNHLK